MYVSFVFTSFFYSLVLCCNFLVYPVTTYFFLIRMYPVKTKGEPKAGAGFLTNYQPKSGANHICYKNATQSRGNLVSVQIDIHFGA